MLGEINGSKATFANLLASAELANNLVRLLLRIRLRRPPGGDGRRRWPWSRHGHGSMESPLLCRVYHSFTSSIDQSLEYILMSAAWVSIGLVIRKIAMVGGRSRLGARGHDAWCSDRVRRITCGECLMVVQPGDGDEGSRRWSSW